MAGERDKGGLILRPRLEIERPRGRKASEKVNVTCGGADLEGLRLEVWAGKRETCVMTGVPQVPVQ